MGRRGVVAVATPGDESLSDDDMVPPECKKMRIPRFCLKWNGETFPTAKNEYQKYRCQGRNGRKSCGNPVRTYCLCDPKVILCDDCLIMHRAKKQNTGLIRPLSILGFLVL